MKLFVWEDAIGVPYGGSVVVAVAETLEQAAKLATAEAGGAVNLGEPTQVLPLPAAYAYAVGGN